MRVHRCFERATFNAAIALPNANLPESEWDHIRFEALMEAAEQLDPHAHHVGMVMAYKDHPRRPRPRPPPQRSLHPHHEHDEEIVNPIIPNPGNS